MEQILGKTDEELVALSLKDKEAFFILVERYKDKISRYIKRISLIRGDFLEDLLQEIFIKVYINLNSFDQDLKFSSWIYRIAHNETISYIRKNKKHEDAVSMPDEDLQIFADEMEIEKDKTIKDTFEVLNRCILKLKEKYKSVIILKFIENKSYEEISDILKIPINTVGTQINRAKKNLKKALISNGVEV